MRDARDGVPFVTPDVDRGSTTVVEGVLLREPNSPRSVAAVRDEGRDSGLGALGQADHGSVRSKRPVAVDALLGQDSLQPLLRLQLRNLQLRIQPGACTSGEVDHVVRQVGDARSGERVDLHCRDRRRRRTRLTFGVNKNAEDKEEGLFPVDERVRGTEMG